MALFYNNNNVSPSSQVYINSQASQKVFYNNTLVWQKTKQFYPGTTVQVKATNTGNYGSFYVNLGVVSGTATNVNGPVVYIPVDLTGIKKLRLGCSGYTTGASSNSGIWIANATQWSNDYAQSTPYFTVGPGTSSNNYVRITRASDGSSFGSFEFDVSDLSGVHYLACGLYINPIGVNCTAGVNIDTVYGDY